MACLETLTCFNRLLDLTVLSSHVPCSSVGEIIPRGFVPLQVLLLSALTFSIVDLVFPLFSGGV
jgi:hypothetical protein